MRYLLSATIISFVLIFSMSSSLLGCKQKPKEESPIAQQISPEEGHDEQGHEMEAAQAPAGVEEPVLEAPAVEEPSAQEPEAQESPGH